jgi:cell division septation protein DedD
VSRAASNPGLGWLATIGGTGILLVLGFGIGLVAGSALEEPDLVAKHLAGEGTELPLPEQAPAARPSPAPGAAAPAAERREAAAPSATQASDFDTGDGREKLPPEPQAVGPAAKPEPAATPAPKPAPRAPAHAVAARPSGFAIQVGAFTDRRAADELVASLRGDRLRAYVAEGGPGEAAPFRVRVGPYATRAEAGDEAARLQARRRLPTWVIAEGGP